MGEVFAAVDQATGLACAVKVLQPRAADAAKAKARFLREAVAAQRVDHPRVVRVLDIGVDDELVYIALERLHGASLDVLLQTRPAMSERVFVAVAYQAADALAAIHDAGIVHRDVKPGNLFVHRPDGGPNLIVKLLDFGISKIVADDGLNTASSSFLGSPKYMSPEQVLSAKHVDRRTDLWSLGVILFDALVGYPPHHAVDVASLLLAIGAQPAASIDALRPDLPAGLRKVIRECLRPLRQRLADARAVRDALGAVLVAGVSDAPLPARRAAPLEVTTVESVLPSNAGEITAIAEPFAAELIETVRVGG